MKYSVLTVSNSRDLNHYKKYVSSLNKQIILPSEIIFINNKIKINNIRNFLFSNLNKKIKIKFFTSFVNKKLSHCLNIGLINASNLIIFRLDIDDEWLDFHTRFMLNEFKKNKSYLIYSNDYKLVKFKLRGFADSSLIIDNPTIHSSWLLNLNICRKFHYKNLFPEDYGTLSYYFRKGYRFLLLKKKTVIINSCPNGLGSQNYANSDLRSIKKSNLSFYLKDKNYFNLIKDLGFFGLLKFLFFR